MEKTKWHIIDSLHNPVMAPYRIKKECYLWSSCLAGAGRMLLFMAEQVFLLMGEVWRMRDAENRAS